VRILIDGAAKRLRWLIDYGGKEAMAAIA